MYTNKVWEKAFVAMVRYPYPHLELHPQVPYAFSFMTLYLSFFVLILQKPVTNSDISRFKDMSRSEHLNILIDNSIGK